MVRIMSDLTTLYHDDRMTYALVSIAVMLVAGTLLGLLMDWLGRKLGVDTSALRHRRQKVKR
jgi:hypothetical protein